MFRPELLHDAMQAVCDAVLESIQPRSAADAAPRSAAGVVASVADKADSLLGLAAAGCLPTASADAFGMRRIMYGLLQTLISSGTRASVSALFAAAAAAQPVDCGEDVQAAVREFCARRLEQLCLLYTSPSPRD